MKLQFSVRDLLWLTLVAGLCLGWWLFSQRGPSPPKWEYKDYRIRPESDWAFAGEHINPLGEQGWEVCGTVSGNDGIVVLLKRPKN